MYDEAKGDQAKEDQAKADQASIRRMQRDLGGVQDDISEIKAMMKAMMEQQAKTAQAYYQHQEPHVD